MRRTHNKRDRSDVYGILKDYWALGLTLAVGTATFLSSLDRIKAQVLSGTVQGLLPLAVLLATLFWLIDFLSATRNELEICRRYQVLDRIPLPPWQAIALVTILSVCLGGLIASITYPVIYCSIAIGIQVADCIALWIVQRDIFSAYKANPNLNPIIEKYYLHTPHFVHRIAKLVGFMSGLVLALVGQFRAEPRLTEISWVVVVMTIVIGEGILAFWRHRLHHDLYESSEEAEEPTG
jgi:hypothetical protein